MLDIRAIIFHLIRKNQLSLRQLAENSGVRRQSIQGFLAGGGLHINNLQRVLKSLGYELALQPHQLGQRVAVLKRLAKRVHLNSEKLKSFCAGHKICFLAFYGSVLTDAFDAGSDVDILVDFREVPDFFAFAQMETELQKILRTKHAVHLVTLRGLSPLIAHEVIASAEVVYEQAA